MSSNLSLFGIAQDWMKVDGADVNRFKDALYKAFPDCPKGPMATQWTKPGPVEHTPNGTFVDRYWIVFPGSREMYTIDTENNFAKVSG